MPMVVGAESANGANHANAAATSAKSDQTECQTREGVRKRWKGNNGLAFYYC